MGQPPIGGDPLHGFGRGVATHRSQHGPQPAVQWRGTITGRINARGAENRRD